MSNYYKSEFDKISKSKVKASFIESKVIIWDSKNGSLLFKFGHFGKPVGIKKPKTPNIDRPFELTLFEALYLHENDIIDIEYKNKSLLSIEEFKNKCWNLSFHLKEDLYFVYRHLRDKRYILKPGLKFGSDFSVYKKGPGVDHSPFLIRVFPRGTEVHPLDLVSAGRLANSVKKRYILASVKSENEIKFYEFKWTKP